MELKKGMICKYFNGRDLIEKNIYIIDVVNPTYTGSKDLDPVVIYSSLFQEGKNFVSELKDLTEELSYEDKIIYKQEHKLEPLTDEELLIIKTDDFINKKIEYLNQKKEKGFSK